MYTCIKKHSSKLTNPRVKNDIGCNDISRHKLLVRTQPQGGIIVNNIGSQIAVLPWRLHIHNGKWDYLPFFLGMMEFGIIGGFTRHFSDKLFGTCRISRRLQVGGLFDVCGSFTLVSRYRAVSISLFGVSYCVAWHHCS